MPRPSRSRAGRARRPRRAGSSRAARRGSSAASPRRARTASSPPQSSGWSPSAASSVLTRSGFASGTSILLIATTIGTSAARAWVIDSFVCGITPSSAATTSTAMSVIFAPRARIAVNASWPGVSRKVSFRPSTSVWYAPMCCVMPPGLGLDHRGRADRVEQRRLAVVDVAHDRHDRRPRREVRLGVLDDLRLLVVGRVLDRRPRARPRRRSARPPRRRATGSRSASARGPSGS